MALKNDNEVNISGSSFNSLKDAYLDRMNKYQTKKKIRFLNGLNKTDSSSKEELIKSQNACLLLKEINSSLQNKLEKHDKIIQKLKE